MPNAFNFAASPFDCLGTAEKQLVRDHVDIAYFREGETLLERGHEATHLFIVVKGHVSQLDGDEVVRHLRPGRLLRRPLARRRAREPPLRRRRGGHRLPARAPGGELADRGQRHLRRAALLRPVDEARPRWRSATASARCSRSPRRRSRRRSCGRRTWSSGDTDIVAVARMFQQLRTTSVLVRGDGAEPRLGIFTTSGLQRAILDGRPLAELAGARAGRPFR